jgi:hypothetical protein
MATNVYCDLCEKEVGNDDSFVVEHPLRVMALHYDCGHRILAAMSKALAQPAGSDRAVEANLGDLRVGGGTREMLGPNAWKLRELEERLESTEDLTKRVAAVWKLWLSEAGRGSINPGTFDAMRNLLGMERA